MMVYHPVESYSNKPQGVGALWLRWLIRADMLAVTDIERACFTKPWGEEDFLSALRDKSTIGMIAETRLGNVARGDTSQILGFMIYELRKDSLHLLNFAVHPRRQRKGAGGVMMGRLRDKLTSQRRTRITLDSKEPSYSQWEFFSRQGFRLIRKSESGYHAELAEYPGEGTQECEDEVLRVLPAYAQWDYMQEKGWVS